MDIQSFQSLSLEQLAELSGIDAPRWSRYFRGIGYQESTIRAIAAAMKIDYVSLVIAIEIRRENYQPQIRGK
jgi:transcriptional regulator with XRE-family HTH domain